MAITPSASKSGFCSIEEITSANMLASFGGGGGATAERLELLRLPRAWRLAVGPHLEPLARITAVRGARLVVEVPDNAWKREMERHAREILSRLERLAPGLRVTEIVFRARAK